MNFKEFFYEAEKPCLLCITELYHNLNAFVIICVLCTCVKLCVIWFTSPLFVGRADRPNWFVCLSVCLFVCLWEQFIFGEPCFLMKQTCSYIDQCVFLCGCKTIKQCLLRSRSDAIVKKNALESCSFYLSIQEQFTYNSPSRTLPWI